MGGDEIEQLFVAAGRSDSVDEHAALRTLETRLFQRPLGVRLDRYVLQERIGRGGLGVVYRAFDPELERDVAIKLVDTRALADGSAGQARLVREARALARISHPNVIAVHDVGTYDRASDGAGVYVVMELVDGDDLRAWLQTTRPFREIIGVFIAAGRGLAAAHARGLVHRDFKPANVLRGDDGRVRVLDFGLALAVAAAPQTGAHDSGEISGGAVFEPITRTGMLMGTPRYMAPEQHRGRATDARTDVYSFCVSLYEALYQETPFECVEEVGELARAKLRAEYRRPPRNDLPGWILPILRRGMEPRPRRRFASMEALLAALEARIRRRARWPWALGVCGALIAGPGLISASGGDNAQLATAGELNRLAVMRFDDNIGDERLSFAGDQIVRTLQHELERIDGLEIVDHDEIADSLGPHATRQAWIELAGARGATGVVWGELTRVYDKIRVRIKISGLDGEPRGTFERELDARDVVPAMRAAAPVLGSAALGREVDAAAPVAGGTEFDHYLAKGIARAEGDRLRAAQGFLEKALELDPASAEANYHYALVLSWQIASPSEIERAIEAAFAGQLEPVQHAFLRGWEVYQARDYAGAAAKFEEALSRYGEHRHPLYGLFEAQFHGGRARDAMDNYARLRALAPHFGLGLVHVLDYAGAHGDMAAFQRAMQLAESLDWEPLPVHRARGLLMQGRYDEAIDMLNRAHAPWATRLLVETHALRGEIEAAQAQLKSLPGSSVAVGMLPSYALKLRSGDLSAAADERARIVRVLGSEDHRNRAKEWASLALIDLPTASPARLAQLREGLREAATEANVHHAVVVTADALLSGQLDDTAQLREIAELDAPGFASVAQAILHEREGSLELAAQAWQIAIADTPEFRFLPTFHFALARVRTAQGDTRGASEACAAVIEPPRFDWSWVSLVDLCGRIDVR